MNDMRKPADIISINMTAGNAWLSFLVQVDGSNLLLL